MINKKNGVSMTKIVSGPDCFPASINAENREITFINVDKKKLNSSAFHEGRTAISLASDSVNFDIDKIINFANSVSLPVRPIRIIGHTSFCSSTLLSRLL